jgi:broad specificity phosphatase PhoE
MIKTLYVFRHGETDWNREGRFQGHTNIPLNQKGRDQALNFSATLKKLNLEIILSSDLDRAYDTACLASQGLDIKLIKNVGLRECSLGVAEGKLIKDFDNEAWTKWLSIKDEDQDFCFEGGESKIEHLMRLKNSIISALRSFPEYSRIGISTHGGCLRRLIHSCEGAPSEPIKFGNCDLYEITYDTSTNSWLYNQKIN